MKLTNTKTKKNTHVTESTIEVLNFLAARGFSSHTEENKERLFYCSLQEIAKAINKSITTANHHVLKLKALGVLDIRCRGGNKSIYKVNEFKVTEI